LNEAVKICILMFGKLPEKKEAVDLQELTRYADFLRK